MDNEFRDKIAVVTGGAMGIGGAVALLFAERGANVVIFDKARSEAEETINKIKRAGGKGLYIEVDVSKDKAVSTAVTETISYFGKINIVSNNAGIQRYGTVESTSEDEWDEVMNVNLKSVYLVCHYAIPFLKKTKGCIINMSSVQALATQRNVAAYTTSKNAIVGLTRSIALDFAKDGIRANCIAPGSVDTPLLKSAASLDPDPESVYEACRQMHPLGRIASPREVAEAVVFLASERASFITGSLLTVDGGLLLPIGGEPKITQD